MPFAPPHSRAIVLHNCGKVPLLFSASSTVQRGNGILCYWAHIDRTGDSSLGSSVLLFMLSTSALRAVNGHRLRGRGTRWKLFQHIAIVKSPILCSLSGSCFYCTWFYYKKTTIFLKLSIAAAPLFTLCFSSCLFKSTPPKKPSLLWLVISYRSEQAQPTTVLTTRLKTKSVNMGCVHFSKDWVFWRYLYST